MKIASTVSRYLLGIMFAVFGANGFLHFIKQPPPSSADALQFLTSVTDSHYMVLIFLLQFIAGVLLLVGRFVPLALVVLGAILVNILDFHVTMDPQGLAPGSIATILWLGAVWGERHTLGAMFTPTSKFASR